MRKTVILLASSLACNQATAACFQAERAIKLEYQYKEDLISSIDGFIEKAPKVGKIYGRALGGVIENRISQKHYDDVVIKIANNSLDYSLALAGSDLKAAVSSYERTKLMALWQSHMRENEDFLYSLQQNHYLMPPGKMEEIEEFNKVKSRAEEFAKKYSTFKFGAGGDATNYYIRQNSVVLRHHYSDYLRAFELPQLVETMSNALLRAHINKIRISSEKELLGWVTCPVQCQVVATYVWPRQRIRSGDKLASVISPYHKAAVVSFPANHILNFLDPNSNELTVELIHHRLNRKFANYQDVINATTTISMPRFLGKIEGTPVEGKDNSTTNIKITLDDPKGNADIMLNVLDNDTSAKISPVWFSNKTEKEKFTFENKISQLGLSCE